MLYSRVLFVTLPACILARCHGVRGVFSAVKIEIRPFVGKSRLVFYLDVQTHEIFLVAAVFVDRSLRRGAVKLQHEHGFARPPAVREVVVVRGRFDEDVGEHFRIVRVLRIAHAEARGEINPAAVVSRTHQFAVGGELRIICHIQGGKDMVRP